MKTVLKILPLVASVIVLPSSPSVRAQVLVTRSFVQEQNIPDPGELPLFKTWDLPGATINSLRVGLEINERVPNSGFNGDLYVTLGHNVDDGYAVLLNRPGKNTPLGLGYAGDHGMNVTFDDLAANGDIHVYRQTLNGGANIPLFTRLTGTWAPDARSSDPDAVVTADARTALLSSFAGKPVSGDWRLLAADLSAGGTHRLDSWSLEIDASIPPAQTIVLDGDKLQPTTAGQVIANAIELRQNSILDASVNFQLSGQISGTGGFSKTGPGELVLSGNNTYAGSTIIQQGKIIAQNAAGSATGGGTVDVSGGGSVGGSGQISGTLLVHDGGTVAPGSSPGTLSVGSATFGPGGNLAWQINQASGSAGNDPGWDLLVISGNLSVTATSANKFRIAFESLTLDGLPGPIHDFNPLRDYTWTIASFATITGFSPGIFDLDTTGFANALEGGIFQIGATGGQLDLTFHAAVPEPSQWTLIFGALLLAGGVARKIARSRISG